MDLAVPQLRLDLPSRLHPHEDRAQQHTQAWVQERGMIANSPKAREVNDSFLLGRLAARVYPHASVGRCYVLADWMSAYFILDDVLDDTVGPATRRWPPRSPTSSSPPSSSPPREPGPTGWATSSRCRGSGKDWPTCGPAPGRA
ncbi:hypothetical protein [Streptomyces sp. NPDC102283]|uniref:hypothetical protein n=1 Tax=Streptomyces sp. NPDC102283 TaxID=3366155 RepID=UPI003813AA88